LPLLRFAEQPRLGYERPFFFTLTTLMPEPHVPQRSSPVSRCGPSGRRAGVHPCRPFPGGRAGQRGVPQQPRQNPLRAGGGKGACSRGLTGSRRGCPLSSGSETTRFRRAPLVTPAAASHPLNTSTVMPATGLSQGPTSTVILDGSSSACSALIRQPVRVPPPLFRVWVRCFASGSVALGERWRPAPRRRSFVSLRTTGLTVDAIGGKPIVRRGGAPALANFPLRTSRPVGVVAARHVACAPG
jgi:hypothetical protein